MQKNEKFQEALTRAKKLHQDNLVVDCHYDLLCMVFNKRQAGRTKVIETDYLPELKEGGVDLLICSLFVSDRYIPEMALRHSLDQIACLYEEIAESPHLIALCRNTQEIEEARSQGKLAILLSFEGVDPIGNDINLLRVFHSLGVRGVGLVWSRRNYAADGCLPPDMFNFHGGTITYFGSKVIQEAQRLGMYIDVSHLSDRGFDELCSLYEKPFMASHSNCRSLVDFPRNLRDDQVKTIISRGGVIGLNVCAAFAGHSSEKEVTYVQLAEHGVKIKELGGINSLAYGFDFCDELGSSTDPSEFYDCIKGHANSVYLTAQLLLSGFSEEEMKLVLGQNVMDFLKKTIG